MAERALTFDCEGERLIAILAEPDHDTPSIGVMIVVGGPQYRAGSHRQFVLFGRRLASAGIAVMRFDYRGMGDSTGCTQTFEQTDSDIAAAMTAFAAACPSLERILLWGLCDAASACLLYWQATADPRIAGIVLLNPWIRSEETFAKARLKHYYRERLVDQGFWRKLARGRVNIPSALLSLAGTMLATTAGRVTRQKNTESRFQARMVSGMETFTGPVLVLTSGRDLTAKEFLECWQLQPRWRALAERTNIEHRKIPGADHTFSSAAWRTDVEAITLEWLERRFSTSAGQERFMPD